MKRIFRIIVFSTQLAAVFAWGGDRIVSQHAGGCTIVLKVEDLHFAPVAADGRSYTQAVFSGSVPFGRPGDPEVPSGLLLIALPPGHDGRVAVQRTNRMTREQTVLLPVDSAGYSEDLSGYLYREGPVYRGDQSWPEQAFRIEETGYMGGQRIMRVRVFPAVYHPAFKKVDVYRECTIRVDFVPSAEPERGTVQQARDPLAEQAVINTAQARQWRRSEQPGRGFKSLAPLSGQWHRIKVTEEGL